MQKVEHDSGICLGFFFYWELIQKVEASFGLVLCFFSYMLVLFSKLAFGKKILNLSLTEEEMFDRFHLKHLHYCNIRKHSSSEFILIDGLGSPKDHSFSFSSNLRYLFEMQNNFLYGKLLFNGYDICA